VKKNVDVLVNAFENDYDYDFPCREVFFPIIPNVLGKPVEVRHEFESEFSRMITESVNEALATLRKTEEEIQYKVDNQDNVRMECEKKVVDCTTELEELRVNLTENDKTVSEATVKLLADEKKFREEAASVKEVEDRYATYQADVDVLTKTLEEFEVVVATPPEGKKDQNKHLNNFQQVFKKFFPEEKTHLISITNMMFKGVEALSTFEKLVFTEAKTLFASAIDSFHAKLQNEKPDTSGKDAAHAEVERSTQFKEKITEEMRELRRRLREVTKEKKDAEVAVQDHAKNVEQWVSDLEEVKVTIATFLETVMAAHDFLIGRTEVVEEEPVVEEPVVEVPVVPDVVMTEPPVVDQEQVTDHHNMPSQDTADKSVVYSQDKGSLADPDSRTGTPRSNLGLA